MQGYMNTILKNLLVIILNLEYKTDKCTKTTLC